MKTSSMIAAAWLCGLLSAAGGCAPQPAGGHAGPSGEAADHEAAAGTHGDGHPDERTVRLDATALEAAGVRLATLDASSLEEQVRAPGEVLDDAYGTTLVTPRVEGLVVRRHAKLGDEVAAGAALVTLTSVEVSEAQGQLAIAEQEWRRVESLGSEAVSGRRYAEARIALEQARAKARAYGLSASTADPASGEFTLVAPHAGRITEDSFVAGERIEPGRTLFRLVDERVVWVDAKLPAEVAQDVAAGSAATIVVADTTLTGRVLRQAHRTSEATRTAVVRVEVDNREDRLHAGDYVDVYLQRGIRGGSRITVPNAALIQFEGEPVVFRRDDHGALAPVVVRPGPVMGDHTVIESGLAAGDTVVVDGAFALKARLLKAQLGEGHAH